MMNNPVQDSNNPVLVHMKNFRIREHCLFVCLFSLMYLCNIRMMRWLNTLSAHTYSNEGMEELQKNRDLNNTTETSSETNKEKKNKDEEITSNDNSGTVSSELVTEAETPSEEGFSKQTTEPTDNKISTSPEGGNGENKSLNIESL